MKAMIVLLGVLVSVVATAQGNFDKKAERPIPALNSVSEVSLRTTYSNDSDTSIADKTALFLSDYDKKNNLAVVEATGTKKEKDYLPFIVEKCEGGACGMAAAPAGTALSSVTLATAKEALKKKSSGNSIDKAQFKDGSIWIVQSEAPDKSTGKKWAVTTAVELHKFVPNAKDVTLKYKVLEFAQK